jgi:hypothetical protein
MIHSYRGGCQCGAVVYEVELDLDTPGPCTKSVWQRVVQPAEFALVSGDEQLAGYQFGDGSIHNFCCTKCGMHAYSRVEDALRTFFVVDLLALHAKVRAPTALGADERAVTAVGVTRW